MARLIPAPRRALSTADMLPLDQYDRVRERILAALLPMKRRRRLPLGHHATLSFENRDTVLFQAHEILRAGGADSEGERLAVIAEHQCLIPRSGELTATIFIDTHSASRGAELSDRLQDNPSPVALMVGDHAVVGEVLTPAPGAVHYLRFRLGSLGRLLAQARENLLLRLSLGPSPAFEVAISSETRTELARDLGLCRWRCAMARRRVFR